jgi:hypothetical protein
VPEEQKGDSPEESEPVLDVIKLPPENPPSVPFSRANRSTGAKIDDSPCRFEVVRLLLDDLSYTEILATLVSLYGFKTSELTLAAFKKNYFPYYKDLIDRIDKARHAHLVARITSEMKSAATGMVHEVFELQSLLVVLEEGIVRIQELSDLKRSASYENTLKDFVVAKARLLERITKITGSSGLEEKLKDVARRVALAAQKTLIQYLEESSREKALSLFETELRLLLDTIESGLETTPPPSK